MSKTYTRPRFVVAVTRGGLHPAIRGTSMPKPETEHLSAAVCDRLYGYRVVANFRTEETYGGSLPDRQRKAIATAEEMADALNEEAA